MELWNIKDDSPTQRTPTSLLIRVSNLLTLCDDFELETCVGHSICWLRLLAFPTNAWRLSYTDEHYIKQIPCMCPCIEDVRVFMEFGQWKRNLIYPWFVFLLFKMVFPPFQSLQQAFDFPPLNGTFQTDYVRQLAGLWITTITRRYDHPCFH